MPDCLIALGSNQGDRTLLLNEAARRLASHRGVALRGRSRDHQTLPVGGPAGQGPFLNAAVLVETSLPPRELLAALLQIERDLGRRRAGRWGPRTIDLDLLLYGREMIRGGDLEVPHPRMAWRRFVLEPAAEVAPDMIHPAIGWTIRQLLEHLQNARPYVAMTGPPGSGKSLLAAELARAAGGRLLSDTAAAPPPAAWKGSAGSAAEIELQFIRRRAELLDLDLPGWREQASLWVSDFWFGQSVAYARTALDGSRLEEVIGQWRRASEQVCPPKLIAVVDAPPAWCARRVASPSAPPVAATVGRIAGIRSAILATLAAPSGGPVLRLDGRHAGQALEELTAAVAAMS
ncbi:MAG: 2-amino-4-hydroxy-6-hydroxymethyldihydropteridine diphosphokinase [Pirellulales bacterium]|jgi:2-amino-4-hydroxy-6-hydroxymethyldihydropteridine diphosphokinase|nr:2-amino-4-hydroxy-6-hydroxymethyldihydropteridine diphosphokinase [Thermoguttaceae bacterium]MDD4787200.1 2-amino-4-hydroxy-6-hydroxymethyldihydropteridine diphosphokinase [Pirellulales bacterium]MDI9446558.1 2-amino-4-hydroxy-6-hydroxymethyldihydropteridine diphosphokinase [Planctomycetota bacterium]NLZ00887.1 2-amino-4-hydroxy-6-hydroxymethyldihydropteridine diphosphokinase [Pirellulaceae bacterium]